MGQEIFIEVPFNVFPGWMWSFLGIGASGGKARLSERDEELLLINQVSKERVEMMKG